MKVEIPSANRPEKRPDEIIYRTEMGEVRWAPKIHVWVEIEKNLDNDTYTVRPKIYGPQKDIEKWADVLPKTIENIKDVKEAKKIADKLFANRDKWAD